jgi:hypothetical protein
MITEQDLNNSGFRGFKSIKALQINASSIPEHKGIYLIVTPENFIATLVEQGTGGYFKGKNPNVSLDELEANWVEGANIIYIGKAGGSSSNTTLQSRLKQYLRFGEGKAVGHWGGRLIWQLKYSGDLIVCWKTLHEDEPAQYESALIDAFRKTYGKRPFANLKD